jgi:hypothetical protein
MKLPATNTRPLLAVTALGRCEGAADEAFRFGRHVERERDGVSHYQDGAGAPVPQLTLERARVAYETQRNLYEQTLSENKTALRSGAALAAASAVLRRRAPAGL